MSASGGDGVGGTVSQKTEDAQAGSEREPGSGAQAGSDQESVATEAGTAPGQAGLADRESTSVSGPGSTAEAETETETETESSALDAEGDGAADTTRRSVARPTRRRPHVSRSVLILSLAALVLGALGSWAYNHKYGPAPAGSGTVVRAAADRSTYVAPGDFTAMTVPIRNDSKFPITVLSLVVTDAPRIKWDGKHTVVQPGATANLQVNAPSQCAALPHPLRREFASSVTVTLKIANPNGKSHGLLRTFVSGVLQYAVDVCSLPDSGED